MKIAILGTRGIPNRYGGFERFAEEIALEFSRLGHQVYVTRPSSQFDVKEFAPKILSVNLKVPRIPIANLATLYYDFISLRWATKNDFDAIIECGYSFSPLLLFVSGSIRKILITNPDGIEHKRAKWGFLAKKYLLFSERLAFKLSAKIVCDSRALIHYYSQKYKVKLYYVPYGARPLLNIPERMTIAGIDPNSDYYLLVSRVTPENSIETILSYFVLSGKTCLVVGGLTSKYAKRIKTKFSGYGNIIFLGTIYDQTVLNTLRYYCKGYIHGHSAGGTNPSLLEAMACGCFVIAHDNPFNREVLGENAGFYFNDYITFKHCIARFEELDMNVINEIKQQNVACIQNNFLWSRVALDYTKVIAELEK